MNDDLRQRYRQFDADCARIAYKVRSARDFEPQVFVPTRENRAEEERALSRLLDQARALPAPDPVYALLKTHFSEFIQGQLSGLQSLGARPGLSIGALTGFIDFMARKDSRPAAERLAILHTRLDQADELWAGLAGELENIEGAAVRQLADACGILGRVAVLAAENINEHFPEIPEQARKEMSNKLLTLADKSSQWQKQAAKLTEPGEKTSDSTCFKLEEDYYRRLLREELGVELDDLVEWHDQEVESNRQEVLALASRLNIPERAESMADVSAILDKYAGSCQTPEEMFTRGKDYLARAKEGVRGYVTLPDEECLVLPVPEQIKGHFPWGGYGGGCRRRRPLVGEMYLNEENYRAVTDGWLKMMAIHEAYPGHHVQFVRTTSDPLPETFKLGARSIPLIEGAAHRSERVFEFVFDEDPFYPLFVAYRRHHTAVRIKAELYLRYFGRPLEDAVKLYMDELGFDRATARGQVRAQELMVGYFNCYYYGLKRLLDMEKQYGIDERTYTELLFSVGYISLQSFESFLALSDRDKQRFQTQFPSLLK